MSYHFVNVDTSEYYFCDEDIWISAIEYAKKNDWDPAGTVYDYVYDTDDVCFGINDEMYYLFMLIVNQNEYLEWNGNYIEMKNQVVTYEDSMYLPLCLKGSNAPPGLIEFISKGSFRICSE